MHFKPGVDNASADYSGWHGRRGSPGRSSSSSSRRARRWRRSTRGSREPGRTWRSCPGSQRPRRSGRLGLTLSRRKKKRNQHSDKCINSNSYCYCHPQNNNWSTEEITATFLCITLSQLLSSQIISFGWQDNKQQRQLKMYLRFFYKNQSMSNKKRQMAVYVYKKLPTCCLNKKNLTEHVSV